MNNEIIEPKFIELIGGGQRVIFGKDASSIILNVADIMAIEERIGGDKNDIYKSVITRRNGNTLYCTRSVINLRDCLRKLIGPNHVRIHSDDEKKEYYSESARGQYV